MICLARLGVRPFATKNTSHLLLLVQKTNVIWSYEKYYRQSLTSATYFIGHLLANSYPQPFSSPNSTTLGSSCNERKPNKQTSEPFGRFPGFINERREEVTKVISSLGEMSPNNFMIQSQRCYSNRVSMRILGSKWKEESRKASWKAVQINFIYLRIFQDTRK